MATAVTQTPSTTTKHPPIEIARQSTGAASILPRGRAIERLGAGRIKGKKFKVGLRVEEGPGGARAQGRRQKCPERPVIAVTSDGGIDYSPAS
jgi:hypothetical protein